MTQRLISGLIETEASTQLHQATFGTRDKARLHCVARDGAGDWLTDLPSQALGLHLRSVEFLFSANYRLGIAVFSREEECPDKHRDHCISCAIGRERISRHNHLRDSLF